MPYLMSTSPWWQLYQQVRPIVFSLKDKYAEQFWIIDDWDRTGYRLFVRFCQSRPDLTDDTYLLKLSYLIALIKYLETVASNQAQPLDQVKIAYLLFPPVSASCYPTDF